MDGAKNAEWPDARLWRVESAADEHGADREGRRGIRGESAVEAGTGLREVSGARVFEVRPILEVARIFLIFFLD